MNREREYSDHVLSRIYREGSWPEPGRQIDQAILAASRRAARERSFARRWAPSFAIAATVVLTSTLVLKVYREQPEAVTSPAPEKASPAHAAEAKPAEVKPERPPELKAVTTPQGFSSSMDAGEAARLERAQRDLGFREIPLEGAPLQSQAKAAKTPVPALKKETETTHPAVRTTRRADAPTTPPAAAPLSVFGASPVAPAPQSPSARTAAKPVQPFTQNASQAQRQAPARVEATAPASTPASAPAATTASASALTTAPPSAPAAERLPSAPAQPGGAAPVASASANPGVAALAAGAKAAERSPLSWIEDIRKLMSEGRSEEAGQEIAKFKKRYPDYALPEDLR